MARKCCIVSATPTCGTSTASDASMHESRAHTRLWMLSSASMCSLLQYLTAGKHVSSCVRASSLNYIFRCATSSSLTQSAIAGTPNSCGINLTTAWLRVVPISVCLCLCEFVFCLHFSLETLTTPAAIASYQGPLLRYTTTYGAAVVACNIKW